MWNTSDYTTDEYRRDLADSARFKAILDRISQVTGISAQEGLAELFNVRITVFRQACQHCELKKRWIQLLCDRYNITPEWLLKGEGEQYLSDPDHA